MNPSIEDTAFWSAKLNPISYSDPQVSAPILWQNQNGTPTGNLKNFVHSVKKVMAESESRFKLQVLPQNPNVLVSPPGDVHDHHV